MNSNNIFLYSLIILYFISIWTPLWQNSNWNERVFFFISILFLHLATLGWGGSCWDVIDTFSYFVCGVFHLIFSTVLDFDDIYHAFLGTETFEESFPFFGYVWKDRNKITTILGIHLILLGIRAFLLVFKALYFGSVWYLGSGRGRCM